MRLFCCVCAILVLSACSGDGKTYSNVDPDPDPDPGPGESQFSFLDDGITSMDVGEFRGRKAFWSLIGLETIYPSAPGFMLPSPGFPLIEVADGDSIATKLLICGTAAATLQRGDFVQDDTGDSGEVAWVQTTAEGNTCVALFGVKSRDAFAAGEEAFDRVGTPLGKIKEAEYGVLEGDFFVWTDDDGNVSEGRVHDVVSDTRVLVDAPSPSDRTSGNYIFRRRTDSDEVRLRWEEFEEQPDGSLRATGHAYDSKPGTTFENTQAAPDGQLSSADGHELRFYLTAKIVDGMGVEFGIDLLTSSGLAFTFRPAANADGRDRELHTPSDNGIAQWGGLHSPGDEDGYVVSTPNLSRFTQDRVTRWVRVLPLRGQFPAYWNTFPFPWKVTVTCYDALRPYKSEFFRYESGASDPPAPNYVTAEVTGRLRNAGMDTRVQMKWPSAPYFDEQTGTWLPGLPGHDVLVNEWRTNESGEFRFPVFFEFNLQAVQYRLEIFQGGNPISYTIPNAPASGDLGEFDLSGGTGRVDLTVRTGSDLLAGARARLFNDRDLTFAPVGTSENGGFTDANGKFGFRIKAGTLRLSIDYPGFAAYQTEVDVIENETTTIDADVQRLIGSRIGTVFQQDAGGRAPAINDEVTADPIEGYVSVDFVRSGTSPDSWIRRQARVLSAASVDVLVIAEENACSGDWAAAIEEAGLTGRVRIVTGTELASVKAGRSLGFPIAHDPDALNGGAPSVHERSPAEAVARLKEQAGFVFLPQIRRVEGAPIGNGMLETAHEGFERRMSNPLDDTAVDRIRALGAHGVEILGKNSFAWNRDEVFAMFNRGYFPVIVGSSGSRNENFGESDFAGVTRTYVFWPDFPETGSRSIGDVLAEKMRAGDVYVTGGPRVICLYDADQDGTPETRMGSMVHDPDGKGDLHIVVLARNSDPVDNVYLWQSGRRTTLSGVERNPDELSTDPSTLVRYREIVPVELTKDAWFVVESWGAGSLFTTFRWKTTGVAHALAYTNAIRVDVDGDGKVTVE